MNTCAGWPLLSMSAQIDLKGTDKSPRSQMIDPGGEGELQMFHTPSGLSVCLSIKSLFMKIENEKGGEWPTLSK